MLLLTSLAAAIALPLKLLRSLSSAKVAVCYSKKMVTRKNKVRIKGESEKNMKPEMTSLSQSADSGLLKCE